MFPEYSELDSVIQFWIDYWKEAGLKFPKDFEPFIVKVIIAVESSFKLQDATKTDSYAVKF